MSDRVSGQNLLGHPDEMARPRKDLGHARDVELKARTARGDSAEHIASKVGQVSARTIRRRKAELQGKSKKTAKADTAHSSRTPTQTEYIPENVPENTPLERLDSWISMVEKAMRVAEVDGNLGALSSLAMRLGSLAEVRRKNTPLPKPDLNEDPEFRKLAKLGEDRFAKLVASLFPDDSQGA